MGDGHGEAGGEEWVGEVDPLLALGGDGDRGDGGVEGAVLEAAQQAVDVARLELVAQLQLVGEVAPEVHRGAGPALAGLADDEGRGVGHADRQRARGRGRGGREGEDEGEGGAAGHGPMLAREPVAHKGRWP